MGNADGWYDDLDEENRLGYELDLDEEYETVGFAITHEISLAGEWFPVVRYLYKDGKIYLEKFPRGGRQPLQPRAEFAEVHDLWVGWDVVRSRLVDRAAWEMRVREYLGPE